MPTIDASDVQILLLEMQPEIVASVATAASDSIHRAAAAIRAMANALSIPVTATVVHVDQRSPALIDELRGLEAIVRSEVSPFNNEAIRDRLRANARKNLAIAGISTEIAVFHAAIDATMAGYVVHLLVDGCGGLSDRTDRAALRRMELEGVLPSTISSFFTSLIADMSSASGSAVTEELSKLWGWKKCA